MGRRKRGYSRSVDNVNKARKTLSKRREQELVELARAELAVAKLAARQHELIQDEGEVELWEANIIDSGDEGDDKGSEVCDEDGLTVIEKAEADMVRQWWKEEGLQNRMIEMKTGQHERTVRRHKQKEKEHAKHVAGMGRIDSMMRRMAQMNENTRQGKAAMDGVEDIEILVYEDPEWKAKKKMKDDLEKLLHMLRSKRCPVKGQDKERHEMVRDFMRMKLKNWGMPKKECSHAVAMGRAKGGFVARSLLQWVRSWQQSGVIEKSGRGRHSKVVSWLEDEKVAMKVREWIKTKGEEVTSQTLAAAFADVLKDLEDAEDVETLIGETLREVQREELDMREKRVSKKVSIQARTAREWLNRMGYRWKSVSKGVYIDGHERKDVVQYRKWFVNEWFEMQPHVREWEEIHDEKGVVTGLKKKEKEKRMGGKYGDGRDIVFVTHDESTFSANDGRRSVWMAEGESILRPKGRGRGIMVSEFLTGAGRLKVRDEVSDEELKREGLKRDATVYFEYGGNAEGWWKGEDVVKQVLDTAIPVFEKEFGSECRACFLFDNSTNHGVYAPDALVASRMNWKSGGKQPVMRDGWMGPERIRQVMYEEIEEGGKRKQVPKGIKRVLEERALFRDGLKMECRKEWADENGQKHTKRGCVDGVEDCCGRRILESQPDFREQKGMVEEEITQRGHLVMFYPKFHCELNWIEYFWGDGKRRTRQLCDYTFNGLRKTVPEVLESTEEVRILRWLRKSERIIGAYRDGLVYGTKEFKDAYKSHRRIRARELD
jgi:hypothetical protein